MKRFFLAALGAVLVNVGLMGVVVGPSSAGVPPPPPSVGILLTGAQVVAHGAEAILTFNVTCDDLTSSPPFGGDGYEGNAGLVLSVQLSQASGKTLAQGGGQNILLGNGSVDPYHGGVCNGTPFQEQITVQPQGNGGAAVPFKSGTALLQANGQECGDLVQQQGQFGGNFFQCDQSDQFNPQNGTGDPSEFGQLSSTIKLSSH